MKKTNKQIKILGVSALAVLLGGGYLIGGHSLQNDTNADAPTVTADSKPAENVDIIAPRLVNHVEIDGQSSSHTSSVQSYHAPAQPARQQSYQAPAQPARQQTTYQAPVTQTQQTYKAPVAPAVGQTQQGSLADSGSQNTSNSTANTSSYNTTANTSTQTQQPVKLADYGKSAKELKIQKEKAEKAKRLAQLKKEAEEKAKKEAEAKRLAAKKAKELKLKKEKEAKEASNRFLIIIGSIATALVVGVGGFVVFKKNKSKGE